MRLTNALRQEYQNLYDTCRVRPHRIAEFKLVTRKLIKSRPRYEAAGGPHGVPWTVVAILHQMESSGSFAHHLHNGDPLTARTVRVPSGRPATGTPPFTWEASAEDAIRLAGLGRWSDWSVPDILYRLEKYNGFGYRMHHPEVLSPYLWGWSLHYTRGKYVADGRWSATAVSRQCGAGVLLRELVAANPQ